MKKKCCILVFLLAVVLLYFTYNYEDVKAGVNKSYSLIVSGVWFSKGDQECVKSVMEANKQFSNNTIWTYTYDTEAKGVSVGTSKAKYDEAIDKAYKNCTKNDMAFFFHSGHGMELGPAGLGITLTSTLGAATGWYTYDDLLNKLGDISCKHMVIMIHACKSGSVKRAYDRLSQTKKKKISLFWSSASDELSYIGKDQTVSVYSQTVAQLLSDEDEKGYLFSDLDKNGCVTVKELGKSINENIDKFSKYQGTNEQTPGFCSLNNTNTIIYSNRFLSLDKSKLTLFIGQKTTLQAVKRGISNSFKWSSSNSNIVSVNKNGTITAKKVGSATIKVTAGKFVRTCKVTVKNKPITSPDVKNFKAVSLKQGYIELSWKKAPSATGYQIYRSKTKKGVYSKVVTLKTSVVKYNNKVGGGKTYYYKIRSYKKSNGKTIFGKFSSIKGCTEIGGTWYKKVLSTKSGKYKVRYQCDHIVQTAIVKRSDFPYYKVTDINKDGVKEILLSTYRDEKFPDNRVILLTLYKNKIKPLICFEGYGYRGRVCLNNKSISFINSGSNFSYRVDFTVKSGTLKKVREMRYYVDKFNPPYVFSYYVNGKSVSKEFWGKAFSNHPTGDDIIFNCYK